MNTDQTVRFGSVRYSTPPGLVGTEAWRATPISPADGAGAQVGRNAMLFGSATTSSSPAAR